MGGEGTQRLFDALLVSDIRVDLFEHGQLRAVQRRDMKAGLAHQRQQPDRFQRDGFAAGVRSRDDQKIERVAETDINRNHFVFVDQRMTRTSKDDPPLRVKNRRGRVHIHRELRPRENKIEFDQIIHIPLDLFAVDRGFLRELRENFLDLACLFDLQRADVIVQTHDRHRLDENRRAGRGLIMDHAGDLRAVLGLDRKAVSPVADCNHCVLKIIPH